ncbi:hypothetical protein [Nocardia sp. NPDC057668]|uniref:hypothetical protein n=1 Tax=Nocardia sp. NPDC057668 TaxID=3346202 RepID=UPI00366E4D13
MAEDGWRERARRAQAGAEREQGRVRGGGVDPDYIQRLEWFPGLSHAEIYAGVRDMDPGAMRELADGWVEVADGLSGAVFAVGATTEAAIGEGMAGRIADAAMLAVREFVLDAMDVVGVAHSTGHRITAAAYGAEAVRRSVPPPLEQDWAATAPHVATMIGAEAGGAHDPEARGKELYLQALAALDANYVPTYPAAGSGVPAFSAVYAPGIGDAGTEGAGNRLLGGGGPSGQVVAAQLPPATAAGERSEATAPRDTESALVGAESATDGLEPAYSGEAASRSGAETAAESAAGQQVHEQSRPVFASTGEGSAERSERPSPGRAANPSVPEANPSIPGPNSSVPGSPTVPVSPAAPGHRSTPGQPLAPGGSGPGSPPSGGPGRSFPQPNSGGFPSVAAPSTHSAAAVRSTAQPMGFMPGMYPPGARTGADADADHKTPAWLIRNRESELLGSPPPCMPPVIGSEIPSARTDLTRTDHTSADPPTGR